MCPNLYYSSDLDDMKQINRDQEDQYFDEEENEISLKQDQQSEYTGIQDY